jgi:hypothetical protein
MEGNDQDRADDSNSGTLFAVPSRQAAIGDER